MVRHIPGLFFATRLDLFLQFVADRAGLGGEAVVENGQNAGRDQSRRDQRNKDPVETAAGAEHGDDFISPRHLGQRVEKCQQKCHRDAEHDDARNLEQIKAQDETDAGVA